MGNRLKPTPACWVVVLLSVVMVNGPRGVASAGDAAAGSKGKTVPQTSGSTRTESPEPEVEAGFIDPLGPNAACYVCHMTFVYEELALVHLPEKVTCVKCHGTSGPHANDENIGATKPDITYSRDKIDAHCSKCHDTHDAPAQDVIARWLEIDKPDGEPVCTDCHGTHKIAAAQLKQAKTAQADGGKNR